LCTVHVLSHDSAHPIIGATLLCTCVFSPCFQLLPLLLHVTFLNMISLCYVQHQLANDNMVFRGTYSMSTPSYCTSRFFSIQLTRCWRSHDCHMITCTYIYSFMTASAFICVTLPVSVRLVRSWT